MTAQFLQRCGVSSCLLSLREKRNGIDSAVVQMKVFVVSVCYCILCPPGKAERKTRGELKRKIRESSEPSIDLRIVLTPFFANLRYKNAGEGSVLLPPRPYAWAERGCEFPTAKLFSIRPTQKFAAEHPPLFTTGTWPISQRVVGLPRTRNRYERNVIDEDSVTGMQYRDCCSFVRYRFHGGTT